MAMIRLEPLHAMHWPALETFSLPLEQEKYTTLPRDLDDPLPEGVYPVVITADNPVGFFITARYGTGDIVHGQHGRLVTFRFFYRL